MVLHGPGAAGPSGLPGSIPGQGVYFGDERQAQSLSTLKQRVIFNYNNP